jgi:3-hydroxybutyryl-CoA dehydrogenase
MHSNEVNRIAVIGAGVMGHAIAQTFAQAGIHTALVDMNDHLLERALQLMRTNLATLAEYGTISENDILSIMGRVHPITDLAQAVGDVQFALEAVPEVPDIKKQIFRRLDECCPDEAVIASNTSALDVFKIAEMKRPERLVIAHWFAPAHILPLVEVAPGPKTDPESVDFTAELMKRIGKVPVVMKKSVPGFIVNQIQHAYGLAMLNLLEQDLASPEEIDKAVKYSLGIRLPILGVVQSIDFNGLDTVSNIVKSIGAVFPLIEKKVSKGHLGVKTSKGIYDYQGRSEGEILKKRDILCLKMLDYLKDIKAFDPV